MLYKRILIKLSGEALLGREPLGFCPDVLMRIVGEVKQLVEAGIEVGIVVGAGNFFRGRDLVTLGLETVAADQMGMMATVFNAMMFRSLLQNLNMPSEILSAFAVGNMVKAFNRQDAMKLLRQGYVVIFAGGTGNPLVTTDSAASLRAIEVGADVLLKATNVDGVYDSDPKKNPNAKKYQVLSFAEALDKQLAVMDLNAFCQCRDHGLPIRIFDINKPGALLSIVRDLSEGTLVQVGDEHA